MSGNSAQASKPQCLAGLARNGLFAVSLVAALPVAAQVPCPPPPETSMDSCLAGAWIGSNNAVEQLTEAFTRMGMADLVSDMTAGVPNILAIRIYEDGFFSTIPFNRSLELQEVDDHTGDLIITQFDLRANTQTGQMWTADSRLKFCSSGGDVLFGATMSSPDGTTSTTMPVPGGGAFIPQITYSCSGTSFSMSVALPQPIGNVDYFLTRVDPARFPDELSDLLRPEDE
ncbi:hypothetical protein ACFPOD_10180 [Nitratireductor kimnyeongensis]|uniref:Uncharacterized protein n=1 Tax=Nitratireductor kimnyeongensis TaxID=430679 RepID=A0ABW0T7X2_9HYPH|nr:hypothetical protein [Nitratireductor kimnyeongensis]QZZ36061.1 hypothetical protein KW403_02590 [Nitratireductor kimnyeongensis]